MRMLPKIFYIVAIVTVILGVSGIFLDVGVIGSSILALIGCLVIAVGLLFRRAFEKRPKAFLALAISSMLVIQVVIGLSLFSQNHAWDAGVVDMLARNYLDHGTTEVSEHMWEHGYLGRYGNNIPITLVLAGIYWLADTMSVSRGGLALLFNMIFIFSSGVIVVWLAQKVWGIRAAVFAWIGTTLLMITSTHVATFYTDTVGLFFVSLQLLVFYVIWSQSRHRMAMIGLLGLIAPVGFLIKPTSLIFIMALIAGFLVLNYNFVLKNWNRALKATVVFIGPFLLVMLLYGHLISSLPGFADYSKEELDRQRVSAIHYAGMGALRGLEPYPECKIGAYCPAYVDYIIGASDLDSVAKKNQYSINIAKNSIMTDFPVGYGSFLLKKVSFVMSDGSFSSWGEGASLNHNIIFKLDGPPFESIRRLVGPMGDLRTAMRLLWQAIWLLILGLIGFSAVKLWKSKKASLYLLTLMISIAGLVAYQMIFEGRARYIFLYLPIFILIASYGFSKMSLRGWCNKF
ncbi:MAG: hypothetical protein Q4A34_00820 [Candidatus Saccharibacteria bacterium]|nr:hypothetical protein [Candidatus Saccharibacteria bacterium]